jgi:endonuclease-3 related protein
VPNTCLRIYEILLKTFGPQRWWPAETPFEVMVGAVLTQNTNWKNVEAAIGNLKAAALLSPAPLNQASHAEVALCIRPAGYYNVKTQRLKALVKWFCEKFGGKVQEMSKLDTGALREELLSVRGIGPETADSILLYAVNKPVFVVDVYTYRIFARHGLVPDDADYIETQAYFESSLPHDAALFNEYHALIVRLGKEFCRKKPVCDSCPLREAGSRVQF